MAGRTGRAGTGELSGVWCKRGPALADELTGEVVVPPGKKLEDLTHLADLCVDLLQQNNEQYSEVRLGGSQSSPHSDLTEHRPTARQTDRQPAK